MITIEQIIEISPHPTSNNPMDIVKTESGKLNVANREGNDPRDNVGDYVIVIPENYLLPEWLLRHNDLWNEDKSKGYLKGSKGNRTCVKMIANEPSEVMLVRLTKLDEDTFQITETDKVFSKEDNLEDILEVTKWINPN